MLIILVAFIKIIKMMDFGQKLMELLEFRMTKCNITVPNLNLPAPNFIKASNAIKEGGINHAKSYGSNPFGVLIGLPNHQTSALSNTDHADLARLVIAIFQLGSKQNILEIPTWIVDDNYGNEILDVEYGHILAYLRWGAMNDEHLNDLSAINFEKIKVKPGQGVSNIHWKDGYIDKIEFKRYLTLYEIPEPYQKALSIIHTNTQCTLLDFIQAVGLDINNIELIRELIGLLESARALCCAIQ